MLTTNTWITGLFHDRESADAAVAAILRAGYRNEDVSLVMTNEARKLHFDAVGRAEVDDVVVERDPSVNDPQDQGRFAEGVGVGGLVGGSVGAVLAGIAAVGTNLLLPGLGLVVAGPLAAALAGAGAGSATGGIIGGLVNAGVPEKHAVHYDDGVRRGGILVAVKARSDENAAELRRWFEEAGADNIRSDHAA